MTCNGPIIFATSACYETLENEATKHSSLFFWWSRNTTLIFSKHYSSAKNGAFSSRDDAAKNMNSSLEIIEIFPPFSFINPPSSVTSIRITVGASHWTSKNPLSAIPANNKTRLLRYASNKRNCKQIWRDFRALRVHCCINDEQETLTSTE